MIMWLNLAVGRATLGSGISHSIDVSVVRTNINSGLFRIYSLLPHSFSVWKVVWSELLILASTLLITFCNPCINTINHLLFTCQFAWNGWMLCCNMWGLSWVVLRDSFAFFLSWQLFTPLKFNGWRSLENDLLCHFMSVGTISYSIKNYRIILHLIDVIEVRLVSRVKPNGLPCLPLSLIYFFPNPSSVSVNFKTQR